MGYKIATCSYCSTRAVLVFDKGLHELTCSACGAPLHDMKMMPKPAEKDRKPVRPSPPSRHRKVLKQSEKRDGQSSRERYRKPKRKKRGLRLAKNVFEEIWDVIEDVFD